MKYTVIPGVVLAEICDEQFLVATGPARGRVPYVKGLNETGAYFFSQIKSGLSTESIINDAAERYETTTEIIAPSALSIYFVNPAVSSFGRNAAITPAKPKTDQ